MPGVASDRRPNELADTALPDAALSDAAEGERWWLTLPGGGRVVAVYVPCDSFWGTVAALVVGQIQAVLLIRLFFQAFALASEAAIAWYLVCFVVAGAFYVSCSQRAAKLLRHHGRFVLWPTTLPEAAKCLLAAGLTGGLILLLAGLIPLRLPQAPARWIQGMEIAMCAFCYLVGLLATKTSPSDEFWSHCKRSRTLAEAYWRFIKRDSLIVCAAAIVLGAAAAHPQVFVWVFPAASTVLLGALVFMLTLGRVPVTKR
jgi:hypothetical protein